MTRPFNLKIQCSNCGCITTAETGFSRWMRNRKDLDSVRDSVVNNDMDYQIHKYKTRPDGRSVQCLMFLEVKTRNAEMSPSQSDTMRIVHQLTRTRRTTPTKVENHITSGTPALVYSETAGRDITVMSFGVHLLQFSNVSPDDSEQITWDGTPIDADTLAALLRFDLDPDTLKPLDLRVHHKPGGISVFYDAAGSLPLFEAVGMLALVNETR